MVFPEYHGDPAAGFCLVFHADVGIVPLGNLVCNEQAQSRSLWIGGSTGGVETVKHIGQLFFRNTGPGIGYSEHTGRSCAAQTKIDGAVFRGKFDGIIQQKDIVGNLLGHVKGLIPIRLTWAAAVPFGCIAGAVAMKIIITRAAGLGITTLQGLQMKLPLWPFAAALIASFFTMMLSVLGVCKTTCSSPCLTRL